MGMRIGVFAALRRRSHAVACGIALLAVAAMLWEAWGVGRATAFNEALRSGAGLDRLPDTPQVRFAAAYRLHQQQSHREALAAYSAVEDAAAPLESSIRFNMANLYVEYARLLESRDARDLSLPLYELAKENYRELLRANSGDWRAKYNLEVVLALAPESGYEEPADEYMPEHSRQAAGTAEAHEELP